MEKATIIYKSTADVSKNHAIELESGFEIRIWKPSLVNLIPPGKDKKYVLYWLFHYAGIFRNRDYCSIFIFDKQKLVCSMLVVPAHFKWPFMSKEDLQFTYVMTKTAYRGRGFASLLIKTMVKKLSIKPRFFWYVTDTENISSQKVAEKSGFQFYSHAKTTRILKILHSDT